MNAVGLTGTAESGARLSTFVKGASTPQAVYTNSALTIPAANPAIADALGALQVYLDSTKSYTLRIKTADASTTLFEIEYDAGTGLFTVVFATIPNFNAYMQAIMAALAALGPDLLAAIEQVADIDTEVVIVADAMEDVEAVADNIADVQAVAANLPQLALKAPLDSPALTGTPTAPTASGGTNSTQIATTAFVNAAIAGIDGDITSWGLVTRAAGFDTFAATPTSANLAALVTNETGSGSLVFSTSPSLTTPNLGTPSTAVLTNATGLPIATGVSGMAAGAATFLATPSSANLAALLTDETGSGANVFATSPSLTTPNLGTPSAAVLTNATGLPISTGLSGLAAGAAAFLATPTSANLATLLTDETGSGANVFATSPVLVTPNLGTPSAVTLTNATGLPIATGVSGLAAGVATFLATPTSANLIAAVTNETGTGSLVFATSPTLVTPALGTPSSVVLTNATGLPIATGISGLGTGVATFLGTPSSANLLAAITDETGSGSLVFASSPTLVTPILGVAAATSIDFAGNTANTLTASGGVLTIENKNVVTNGSNSSLATSTTTVGSVSAWSDYEGGGYATTNISAPLMFSSKYGRGASATDAVDTRFVRWANYTGGTAYTTNVNLAVSTMAAAGGNTFEWAGLFTLDSYRTAANATQDVGLYVQSIKNSTGGVWCVATELQDKGGANPSVGTVNTELAGSSLGADNNNQRIFVHIIPSSRDASQTEWGRGILFSTGALAKIKSALCFEGTNYDYIIDYANFSVTGAGSLTALGPTHIFGTSGADTTIRQSTTDRQLVIDGGNTGANGASVQLFGATHATFPGNGSLRGGATTQLVWNSTVLNLPQATASRLLAVDSSKNVVQTITSANLAASVSDETGSGALVFATSPTLVTPALGTPSSATLTNATGLPIATGVSGLGTGVATFLATPTSANLIAAITNETGTGSLVFATSPTLVTPALGTPSSVVLTNATGLPIATGVSGLGTGVATFLATPSSANLIAAITDETGSGSLVFATSPTIASPTITGSPILGASGADIALVHAAADQSLTISGGTSATNGANIQMTGGSAGLPNLGSLSAGSTRAFVWSASVNISDVPMRFTPTAVASLPAAATAGAGARFFVNNATATTFASIVAGGGANTVPVYSDGTNWRIG